MGVAEDLRGKVLAGLKRLQVSGFSRFDGGLAASSPISFDGIPYGSLFPRRVGNVVVQVAQPTMVFAIPQTGDHIEVIVDGRSDVAGATVDTVLVQFNGDSTLANYETQEMDGENATVSAGQIFQTVAGLYLGLVTGPLSTASTSGSSRFFFPNYRGKFQKQGLGHTTSWDSNASGQGRVRIKGGRWLNTVAITQVTLALFSGGNWVAGSAAWAYLW